MHSEHASFDILSFCVSEISFHVSRAESIYEKLSSNLGVIFH